jgi:hypothetical protein
MWMKCYCFLEVLALPEPKRNPVVLRSAVVLLGNLALCTDTGTRGRELINEAKKDPSILEEASSTDSIVGCVLGQTSELASVN